MSVDTLRRAAPLRALRVERLVLDNHKLVHWAVLKWGLDPDGRRLTVRMPDYDDAVSAATVALVRAARAFDPARGFQFATLAVTCLHHEIKAWNVRTSRRGLATPRYAGGYRGTACPRVGAIGNFAHDLEAPASGVEALAGRADPDPAAAELSDPVRRAIDALPPRQRLAVERVVMGGMSTRAVSSDLGVTHQAVNLAKNAALRKLRVALAGQVL
jgi:RNA polymerase sigma factor (sigma-70 family)